MTKGARARAAEEEGQRFKDSLAVVITFWLDMGRTPARRSAMVVSVVYVCGRATAYGSCSLFIRSVRYRLYV